VTILLFFVKAGENMATIRTAIQITDGMSPAFRSMNKAMNIVLNSFEALQTASHNAVDTSSIQRAREELARAETSFNDVEREIREANLQQQQFNESIRNGQSAADGLRGKITQIAAAVGAYLGITKTLDFADELTSTKARLDLMNDGLQTTAELQNMIYASAQRSRTSYLDTAQAVAKLGILAKDAFSSNKEMVAFAEQMNKQFKIGGASIQEQTAAMYQLTQAMAAGRLQGDEFRSIMENAPMLAQAIAKYTGKSIGELREMSSEGLITADVIKNAMFASADETNKKFAELPITFGQIWTSIKNKAIKAFDPVLTKISEITQNDDFEKLTNNIVGGIVIVASAAAWLFEILTSIAGVISDNWSWLEPIVWGLVAAFIAYNAVSFITNTILAVQGFMAKVAAAGQMMQAGATFTATAAQYGLNAALYACPLTWIIILIIALIALFYAAVAAINHFAGTSVSATGIIAGAFMVALAFIGNLFVGLWNLIIDVVAAIWNVIASVAEFLANVFNDPISSIVRSFAGMADAVLGILQGIAKAIDAIFGSNLAGAVSGWRSGLQGAVNDLVGEAEIKVPRMDTSSLYMNRFEYGAAWDTGYTAGESFEKNFDIRNILGGAANSLDAYELGNNLDGIYKGVGDTAANTASMKDSMDVTTEELKYMRDLAEQEVINRFTTAEIKIDMNNENHINSEMDLDGVVTYLEEKLYETMQIAAEGVHE
jgi:tape measure domain-containing protein